VIDYYKRMNGYWLELHHYQDIKMVYSEDAATLTFILEGYMIVEFLVGLNTKYDQVRVQILGTEKLSSLNDTFSMIPNEEYRRITMFDEPNAKGSTMISNKMDVSHSRT